MTLIEPRTHLYKVQSKSVSTSLSVYFLFLLISVLCTESVVKICSSTSLQGTKQQVKLYDCGDGHSCFAWDYSTLGEENGWWAIWYPQCNKAGMQSPIDISSKTATDNTKSTQLVIESASGSPYGYGYVTLSTTNNNVFNIIHCTMVENKYATYIYTRTPLRSDETHDKQHTHTHNGINGLTSNEEEEEKEKEEHEEHTNKVQDVNNNNNNKKTKTKPTSPHPQYNLDIVEIRYPGEHLLDGVVPAAEIVYIFIRNESTQAEWEELQRMQESNKKYVEPDSEDDVVDNIICLHTLLYAVEDGKGDPTFELAISQLLDGAQSGSTRIRVFIPFFPEVYSYMGSLTTPPCSTGVHHYVGAAFQEIEVSTLHHLINLNMTDMGARKVQPLGNRTVSKISFYAKNVNVNFNTDQPSLAYDVIAQNPSYLPQTLWSIVCLLIACNVLFVLVLVILLFERLTFIYPFHLTWSIPVIKSSDNVQDENNASSIETRREIFGVPIHYGHETGQMKVDYAREKSYVETASTDNSQESSNMTRSDQPLLYK